MPWWLLPVRPIFVLSHSINFIVTTNNSNKRTVRDRTEASIIKTGSGTSPGLRGSCELPNSMFYQRKSRASKSLLVFSGAENGHRCRRSFGSPFLSHSRPEQLNCLYSLQLRELKSFFLLCAFSSYKQNLCSTLFIIYKDVSPEMWLTPSTYKTIYIKGMLTSLVCNTIRQRWCDVSIPYKQDNDSCARYNTFSTGFCFVALNATTSSNTYDYR